MTVTTAAAYPAHLEADVVLRTGRTLRIRPVRPSDHEAVRRFFARLSPEALHARFFDARTIDKALDYAPVDVDYVHDFGVVGEIGGEIVAVAHYFASRRKPKVAEVAFAIADDQQGCGVGTHLLEKLAAVARANDIERFEAEVLAENQRMLDVFTCSGFDVQSRSDRGTIHVSFPVASTVSLDYLSAERAQKGAYASMKPVFEPRSIAVIGAGRRPGQLGHEILHNLRTTGFTGQLYAVNPCADVVDGIRCVPSVTSIQHDVDLAIIAVPPRLVEQVIDDCVAKRVRAVVVITAGYGELGKEGRAGEQRLLEKVRASGMRMVGPNCMGVINTDPATMMHGTFSRIFPPAGNIGMSSQSGALGLAILDYARQLGIGFSTFISVGNKADVSGNDLIQYWAEDPHTDVILLYLESFGNPKKFGEIARRVAKRKPIVVVKSGRSEAGARAAASHTGALATSDALVRDLFRQAGIIRTDTLEELFDAASLLSNQPLPSGRRVAILTNAGGPGILAADACEANGLVLPPLEDETRGLLRAILPPAASVRNPVDMIATATAMHYRRSLEVLLRDETVDSILVIYIPVSPEDAADVAAVIRDAAREANGKTIVATFMSAQGLPSSLSPVPAFPFPERAAKALAEAARYAEWRRRPAGTHPPLDRIDKATLRAIVDRKVAEGEGWLEPMEIARLLEAAGIRFVSTSLATTAIDAVEAAMCVGFPAVLKAHGPELLHKSDRGGVRLSLQNEAAVHAAFTDLQEQFGSAMTGAIVQPMVPGGVEVMAGAMEDPTFGPVIAYGAGGTLVELISDVSFRLSPLTDLDAADLVNEVRCSKLLRGFRGAPPADEPALRETLLRLSALIEICPEIRELDINPLKVMEHGVIALDARARVEPLVPLAPSRRIAY